MQTKCHLGPHEDHRIVYMRRRSAFLGCAELKAGYEVGYTCDAKAAWTAPFVPCNSHSHHLSLLYRYGSLTMIIMSIISDAEALLCSSDKSRSADIFRCQSTCSHSCATCFWLKRLRSCLCTQQVITYILGGTRLCHHPKLNPQTQRILVLLLRQTT